MTEENAIFKPGQAVIIADGALLEDAIDKIVSRSMDKYFASKAQEAKEKDWVEQHVAAEMLGVSIWTLRRKWHAGQIDRVVDNTTRNIMYYLKDILREKAALDAKRALLLRNAQSAVDNVKSLNHED